MSAEDLRLVLARHEHAARARLREAGHDLMATGGRACGQLEQHPRPDGWIDRHPLTALAAAVGTGFLLAPRGGRILASAGRWLLIGGQLLLPIVGRCMRNGSPGGWDRPMGTNSGE